MCECLSYDDGSMYLCEVCAGIVRECPHCGPPIMGTKGLTLDEIKARIEAGPIRFTLADEPGEEDKP